jgi:ABC-type Fe3+/spermidine/putrescine transport system ATPase subunit
MTAVITVREVGLTIGRTRALDGVSLTVAPGEIVAVAGPSGGGKSTLLRAVLGLTRPDEGIVEIAGTVASRGRTIVLPPERRNLAMVFQDLALWPHMTARGNLEFALRSSGVPAGERSDRIAAMLRRVALGDKAARRPGELSGGERQRVALARALVQAPLAVLLDEPLASLDVLLRGEMLALLGEILRERRCAGLLVTHEGAEAAALADRVVVLETGRVVQDGTIAALAAAPATPFVRAFTRGVAVAGA